MNDLKEIFILLIKIIIRFFVSLVMIPIILFFVLPISVSALVLWAISGDKDEKEDKKDKKTEAIKGGVAVLFFVLATVAQCWIIARYIL